MSLMRNAHLRDAGSLAASRTKEMLVVPLAKIVGARRKQTAAAAAGGTENDHAAASRRFQQRQ